MRIKDRSGKLESKKSRMRKSGKALKLNTYRKTSEKLKPKIRIV